MANVMTKRGTQDNVVTYEHICDTTADLANIDPKLTNLGSTALVVDGDEGMEFYIADSEKKWIPVTSGGGGEEPTGSVTLTANGTYDVTSKAQAIVAVPQPSGSISITENGTYNITDKAEAVVNVPNSGEVTYGSFTISPAADNDIGFSTMIPLIIGNNSRVNMPIIIKTDTYYTYTGKWPLHTDGYMYIIFAGYSPSYYPSVSATTGTATYVRGYNSYSSLPSTFFIVPVENHTTAWNGQYVIYKVSDGAVLTVTHYNNS